MKLVNSIVVMLSLIVVLTGCHKKGCTDSFAENFNPDATTEDFTCSYRGDVIFWTTIATRDSLLSLGHTMLRFELEGVLVDSMATSTFSASTGDCNSAGAITIPRTMVGNTERTYKYRVKGNAFATVYEGFVTVEADDCAAVKLW